MFTTGASAQETESGTLGRPRSALKIVLSVDLEGAGRFVEVRLATTAEGADTVVLARHGATPDALAKGVEAVAAMRAKRDELSLAGGRTRLRIDLAKNSTRRRPLASRELRHLGCILDRARAGPMVEVPGIGPGQVYALFLRAATTI